MCLVLSHPYRLSENQESQIRDERCILIGLQSERSSPFFLVYKFEPMNTVPNDSNKKMDFNCVKDRLGREQNEEFGVIFA